MQSADAASPVRAKALIVDPASMTVLWMNEAVAQSPTGAGSGASVGSALAEVLPVAVTLGIPDAVRAVVATGSPQHLRADLVSTSKGSMALAASVYALPDGTVLVLMENSWRSGR